ncbi:uncharacterized protein L969DRAFT_93119 [Mixia osmundae IAM 14324]|uniref:Uncharacterized protein n=1 Tax=Mixia osmundae (strain CBS 9802 / IAM 14324 / JCM 22182 / KY 12970) TaxID=764103 RepID=G7E620_MIXOS|nr:uncharacterized protein L969DRAFT_93119 [Mixia osmundae IAM 14324]KEI40571.1 hypothetical protein L969DRAFT_93119 [Mixia osmundae IAM 14324]GAA98280.1 hypothetical protein E5Q_04963 [Mixia osmundae IAM 14324]
MDPVPPGMLEYQALMTLGMSAVAGLPADFNFISKHVKLVCRKERGTICASLFFLTNFELDCVMLEGYCEGLQGSAYNGIKF